MLKESKQKVNDRMKDRVNTFPRDHQDYITHHLDIESSMTRSNGTIGLQSDKIGRRHERDEIKQPRSFITTPQLPIGEHNWMDTFDKRHEFGKMSRPTGRIYRDETWHNNFYKSFGPPKLTTHVQDYVNAFTHAISTDPAREFLTGREQGRKSNNTRV